MVTMLVPLYANGFSELEKLINPGTTVEIVLESAKPEFYLVSNDDTKVKRCLSYNDYAHMSIIPGCVLDREY